MRLGTDRHRVVAIWGCPSPAPAPRHPPPGSSPARRRTHHWLGKSCGTNTSSASETWHPCVPGCSLQPFRQLHFFPWYVFWQVAGSLEQWSMASGCCRGCRGLKAAGTHFSLAQMPATAIDLNWSFKLEFSPGPVPSRTTQSPQWLPAFIRGSWPCTPQERSDGAQHSVNADRTSFLPLPKSHLEPLSLCPLLVSTFRSARVCTLAHVLSTSRCLSSSQPCPAPGSPSVTAPGWAQGQAGPHRCRQHDGALANSHPPWGWPSVGSGSGIPGARQ